MGSVTRERCARHDLAVGDDGACVLCRREAAPAPAAGRTRVLAAALVVIAMVAAGVVVIPRLLSRPAERAAPPAKLTTKNSAGRDGAYFLPSHYEGQKLPLLVALHSSSSSGASMVEWLRESAERERFIIVAPDSRVAPSGEATWEVGDTLSAPKTGDFTHVQRCVDEVLAMPGVEIDATHVLIAGHSGGASSAPYIASWDDRYTEFAVLHGGAWPGGLGPHKVRGWFSTGTTDTMRPLAGVQAAAEGVRRVGFMSVEVHTFTGGHGVGDDELRALLAWWLGR